MTSLPVLSLMKSARLALPLLLLVGGLSVRADDTFQPVFHPELNVTRKAGEIKIDGHLNDPGWQNASSSDHFHETNPGDNIKPPVKTRVLVTYDDDHLYLAAICYDDPSQLRTILSERDRMGGDNIGFFFDTYGNATWAYTINVNPYGVQADALWTNGFGEDDMFDLVFESAGQITDSGYQVELAIPFASLRFPNTEEQTWRMQFWRHHYRDTHYNITWAANDRSESNWVRNWGFLKGIKNVKPGKGIEIIPAWTGFKAGRLQTYSDSSLNFVNEDAHGELSLSGKYSITSNVTLDAAINPDFSSVESDAFQIDVNSPTALSFPEKRPFFQEGSDLYRTRLDLVYTRSINEPSVAAKMTARLGKTSISYLGARDTHSPFIIPFEETSSGLILGGKSFSNILRVRRTLGPGSQLGLLLTDRHWDGGGNGTTFSGDATLSINRQITFRAQAVGSYFKEPDDLEITAGLEGITFDDSAHTAVYDGESFSGYALSGNLSYNSRDFYISSSFEETGPKFRADNGWIPRNSRRELSIYSEYNWRFDSGLLERISLEVQPMRVWNTDGQKKDEAVYTTAYIPLRLYQSYVRYQNLVSTELFAGTYYKSIFNHHIEFGTSPTELLSFGGNYNYGNQIAYGYRALGRQTKWTVWVDLNLFDRIYWENWTTHVKSRDVFTEEQLFDGYLFSSRLNYQYSRRLSMRFFAQYNDFSKTWDFDPLITYKITPFTMFYVGSTIFVQKYDGLDRDGNRMVSATDPQYSHNKLESRQFFVKLQYLFQL